MARLMLVGAGPRIGNARTLVLWLSARHPAAAPSPSGHKPIRN
jgi:hypothetical protein